MFNPVTFSPLRPARPPSSSPRLEDGRPARPSTAPPSRRRALFPRSHLFSWGDDAERQGKARRRRSRHSHQDFPREDSSRQRAKSAHHSTRRAYRYELHLGRRGGSGGVEGDGVRMEYRPRRSGAYHTKETMMAPQRMETMTAGGRVSRRQPEHPHQESFSLRMAPRRAVSMAARPSGARNHHGTAVTLTRTRTTVREGGGRVRERGGGGGARGGERGRAHVSFRQVGWGPEGGQASGGAEVEAGHVKTVGWGGDTLGDGGGGKLAHTIEGHGGGHGEHDEDC